MRIIALPGDLSACGYYRVFAPLAAMERAGLAEVHRPEPVSSGNGGKPQVFVAPNDLRDFDIAVFQRQPEQRITELFEIAQGFGTRVVFDLDDDVYSIPPNSPAYLAFGRDWRKVGGLGKMASRPIHTMAGKVNSRDAKYEVLAHAAKQWTAQARDNFDGVFRNLRKADLVTVSTEKLRQVYSKHRDDIVVLRNQIEPRDWYNAIANPYSKPSDEVWIGWAGSPTHWPDLKEIARAVVQVARRHSNVRVVLVGFPEAVKLFGQVAEQVVVFPWMSITEYRSVVAAFDIALAPSAPLQFNEAKSDIRVLEAALCGVPVVASETTYGDTVREASCGLVAKTSQKWQRHLERLITDPGLRATMGLMGQEYVSKRTYDANAWRWAEAYSKLI